MIEMTVLFLLFYCHMIVRVFLIYSSDLMYVLTQLRYALICQVKEKEKFVVLKMLLQKRAKAQQEIKMD